MRFSDIAAGLPDVLAAAFGSGSDIVIDREPPTDTSDQPWLAVKYGPSGDDDVHGVTGFQIHSGDRVLDLIVKVNPVHGIGETLIPWIVQHHDVALPQPYPLFHSTAEVVATGTREANLYELSRDLPELEAVLPVFYGVIAVHGERAIVVADEGHVRGLDAGGTDIHWSGEDIDTALRGIGAVHAASTSAVGDVAWLPRRPTADSMSADSALWRALLADAADRFPDIVTDAVQRNRETLIETLPTWHAAKDVLPTVLAHNDFNPRNVGFRADGRLLVLDWELARKDSPTRDVAELLTFTLDPNADEATVRHHAREHRHAMAAHGIPIAEDAHLASLAADLNAEAIDRVGMQLLLAAAFDLPYVPAINATVDHLNHVTASWLS
ncbi:MAG: aminoglycoside phosphotransferase family protein [Candidatus Nanopelagicales bacterium]